MKPTRYIIIRTTGVIATGKLYELRDTSDYEAPEYVRVVEGSMSKVTELARKLNAAADRESEVKAGAVETVKEQPKVRPCLYSGCRGLAEHGRAFCPSHRPRSNAGDCD